MAAHRGNGDGQTRQGRPGADGGRRRPDLVAEVIAPASLQLAAGGGQERAADLAVRLALLRRDLLGQGAESAAELAAARGHRLVAALQHGAAVSASGDPAGALAAVQAALEADDAFPSPVVLRDIAEAWLYRFGDGAHAAGAALSGVRAIDAQPDADSGGALRAELTALHELGLAVAGRFDELGDRFAAAVTQTPSRAGLAAALRVLHDRLGAVEAAALLASRLDSAIDWRDAKSVAPDEPLFALLLLLGDIGAAEVERRADEESCLLQPGPFLERRLELLEGHEAAAAEARATSYLLGQLQRRRGEAGAAAELFSALTTAVDAPHWGERLARITLLHVATEQEAWDAVVEALLKLGSQPGAGRFNIAYLRRAAEVAEARLGNRDRALELWRRLLAQIPDDDQALGAVERLLLCARDASVEDLLDHLQHVALTCPGRRAACLRRAAAVAESRAGDKSQAIALRAASLRDQEGTRAPDVEVEAYLDLGRLLAAAEGERDALHAVYRDAAERAADARSRAALLCVAGTLELAAEHLREAEDLLAQAVGQDPDDFVARAALAALYRQTERWADLTTALAQLASLMLDPSARVGLLRELGAVCADRLSDVAGARSALEEAFQLDPGDAEALRALAALCDREQEWGRAITLRRRALETLEEVETKVPLLLEIGRLEHRERGDADAALAVYQRVLELEAASVEALRAQGEIYSEQKKYDSLVSILERQLEMNPAEASRIELLIQLARAEALRGNTDAALAAYCEALQSAPDHREALAGVRQLAHASGRWDVVVEVFRRAPRTPATLSVLEEALKRGEQWAELVKVKCEKLEIVGQGEKAALAQEIGQIYANRLNDPARAADMYTRALDQAPMREDIHKSLRSLLETNARWPELAAACERELAQCAADDHDKRVALLARLGSVRSDKLDQAEAAAQAYEELLTLRPRSIPALEALEGIYRRLGRPDDLLRVIEARAAATEDPRELAEPYARIGAARQQRGEVDAAVAAYWKSFFADPSNRDVFTALEKLCYDLERWVEVMELYETAISQVEAGTVKAYRLADLYARRGQVEFRYLEKLPEAMASYGRVLELEPENEAAVRVLEAICSQQGNWRGLIRVYQTRAELTKDPETRVESLRRAARIAAGKLNDHDESSRLYTEMLAIRPGDSEALDALERFHERRRDWNQLVAVLTSRLALVETSEAAVALLRRVARICEEQLHDEQGAVDHYLRILEMASNSREALEALGRIYESTEQWDAFVDVTRRHIRVATEPNVKALLYFKCGSVLEAKFGNEEDAIRCYKHAIRTWRKCLPAVHGLRDLYRRRQDWPRVIQTLEVEVKLWQDSKEKAGVFAQIGRIYSEHLAAPERALHYFESALATDSECVPANRALFEHYFDRSEWERAQPLAEALSPQAMRDGEPTERSEFYRKRGIVASMTGDMRTAAESVVVALEIKPMNLAALDALGELVKKAPDSWDFSATFRELDKIYRRRDDAQAFLARVRVAQAIMREREGDLEAAEALYAEASELAPEDFAILSALVDLHCNMRHWSRAIEAITRFLAEDSQSDEVRVQALLRQAEIHADCEVDPERAAAVYRAVLDIDPANQVAAYRMAQELYALRRYRESRAAIEQAIALAAIPGTDVRLERLARYYYYLGRIIETSGEPRAATSHYRRAAEYDPGYPSPVLALAKRVANAGDTRQAEAMLISAAHAAMEANGAEAAISLQRTLARILLKDGDLAAAIEAYRGILAVEPDGGAVDRVALAEIYAVEDTDKALAELHKVIEQDVRHAPAYQLMASLYRRQGALDRAARVYSAMEVLGFADEADRQVAAQIRAEKKTTPFRRPLDENLRRRYLLLDEAARSPLGELFAAIAANVTQLFTPPRTGDNLVPAGSLDQGEFKVVLGDLAQLFVVEPEVYAGDNVPGEVVTIAYPRPIVVLDRALLAQDRAVWQFALSYAFDGIRGGYAVLFGLPRRQKSELGALLRSLLLPESERGGPTNEFVRRLPPPALQVIERLAGAGRNVDTESWFGSMLASAKRAGLFGSDDFAASTRMIARMSGEVISAEKGGTAALATVLGGPDLVRFYLSDAYHHLRETLRTPLSAATA